MKDLVIVAAFAPLLGAIIAGLGGKRITRQGAHSAAIFSVLLSVNLNFIAFSSYLQDMAGQVFVFFILTVAAAESAIGLAILVVLFRNLNTIDVEDLDSLKG